MKTFLLSALAGLALLAAPAAFADPDHHDHDRGRYDHRHDGGRGHNDRGWHGDRGWRGDRDRGWHGHRPLPPPPPPRYYGHGHYYQPAYYNRPPPPPRYYGHWERGHRYYGSHTVIRDYGYYRLRPPPRGYHWVRDNNDFLLVAIATGIILDMATR